MVPAITMIQAYKCFKYDIIRPNDILVQRETITVGEKINIVRPDFFFSGLHTEYKNGKLDKSNTWVH